MSVFDFLKRPNIDQGVQEYRQTYGAVLLDVRSVQEYKEGHIPGSINIPLPVIESVQAVAENKETPLFVYCYSGSRSSQAAGQLSRMGYRNVKNIGGMAAYNGRVEK